MLVREHAPDYYHIESYFELEDKLSSWVNTWEERELSIGGPHSHSMAGRTRAHEKERAKKEGG